VASIVRTVRPPIGQRPKLRPAGRRPVAEPFRVKPRAAPGGLEQVVDGFEGIALLYSGRFRIGAVSQSIGVLCANIACMRFVITAPPARKSS
jgi:hypothetical protein